jgi:hypothetical protein
MLGLGYLLGEPSNAVKLKILMEYAPEATQWGVIDLGTKEIVVSSNFDDFYLQDIEDRKVKVTRIFGTEVSTVFLGLNHGTEDAPLWFETMLMPQEELIARCETYQMALEQHDKALKDRWGKK